MPFSIKGPSSVPVKIAFARIHSSSAGAWRLWSMRKGPCSSSQRSVMGQLDCFMPRTHSTALPHQKLGLFFASQGGTTEDVAKKICKMINAPHIAVEHVKEAQDLTEYDALIVGTPTRNTLAEEYHSGKEWDDIINEVKETDLTGKKVAVIIKPPLLRTDPALCMKVAVFGLGDSNCYPEGFCDAMEELHSVFQSTGASMIGYVDSSGYEHSESKSDIDGKFIGLALDELNEDHLTDDRLKSWILQLKKEGMPL